MWIKNDRDSSQAFHTRSVSIRLVESRAVMVVAEEENATAVGGPNREVRILNDQAGRSRDDRLCPYIPLVPFGVEHAREQLRSVPRDVAQITVNRRTSRHFSACGRNLQNDRTGWPFFIEIERPRSVRGLQNCF